MASKNLLTPCTISHSHSLHWTITDSSSSCSNPLKRGRAEFGLRCHEGVSGMEGGKVFHPEYFLSLFAFGDNRNQGDASLMGGWERLSAQKLLLKTLLARECLTLNLASLFPLSAFSLLWWLNIFIRHCKVATGSIWDKISVLVYTFKVDWRRQDAERG